MPKEKPKFTAAQIKEHTKKIQAEIEKHRKSVKKGEDFSSLSPEEIEEKLKRVNSPMITSQSWSTPVVAGGTVNYSVTIFNPDPTSATELRVHVWIGPGNPDSVVGTFLLNVDTRFPRLTQPNSALTIASGASATVSFALKVPTTVEKTVYLGNSCAMRVGLHDVGSYYDRGCFPFQVT